MTAETENLVLEHLRHIRADIDGLRLDVRDVKHRLTALEITTANFAAAEAGHYAATAARADRTDERLDRIERRLDLIPA
jgi:hypothetical protein